MNGQERQNRDFRFLAGLAMGSVVGAGLALWLAPRAAAEIKARAVDSAKNLGDAASEQYRDAKLRVTGAVDGFTRKGQGVRDGVLDTVVRGAKDVERGAKHVEIAAQDVQRYAADAKTPKVG
jgi:gas vesicle protein